MVYRGGEGVNKERHDGGTLSAEQAEAMLAGRNPFPAITVTLDESERQAVLLALARLSVECPGWQMMLGEIAQKFEGQKMFEEFRTYAGAPPGFPKDRGNVFEVVRHQDTVVVLNMNPEMGQFVFRLGEALELAAWLAVLADPHLREFLRLVAEIQHPPTKS